MNEPGGRQCCARCGAPLEEPRDGSDPEVWRGTCPRCGGVTRQDATAAHPGPPSGAAHDPEAPPVAGGGPSSGSGLGLRVVSGGGTALPAPVPDAEHLHALPAVPPGHCPACLADRAPSAASCPRCGLDFLRADPAQLAPSDRLARDWFELRQDWESPRAHHRYLQRAGATGELSAAGRLYRLFLLHHPEDLQASAALDGMVQRALAAGLPRRSRADGDEAERRRVSRALQWLMVLLLCAGLLFAALR